MQAFPAGTTLHEGSLNGVCSCRAPAFIGLAGYDPAAGTSLAIIELAIGVPFANTNIFSHLESYAAASSLDSQKQFAHSYKKT
jgi:hypothetical protein